MTWFQKRLIQPRLVFKLRLTAIPLRDGITFAFQLIFHANGQRYTECLDSSVETLSQKVYIDR